jgi:hypothetical protein
MSAPNLSPRALAAVCGLPADGTPAELTAAFLRALPGEQFAPREEEAAAVSALAGVALPVGERGAAVVAADLAAEAKGLAAAFWSLPPADRRARWAGLSGRCRDEAVRHRLAALEPGLDIEVKPHADPAVEELAEFVRGQFTLAPREAAVRRVKWLAARAARHADLTAAAERLRRDDPATASLAPALLRLSLDAECPIESVTGAFAAPDSRTWVSDHVRLRRPVGDPDPSAGWEKRDAANARRVFRSGCLLFIGLWVAVAGLTCRSTIRSNRPEDRVIPPAPPASLDSLDAPSARPVPLPLHPYQPPADLLVPSGLVVLTRDQVAGFQAYERLRDSGASVPREPDQFALWVKAGRPVPQPGGTTAVVIRTGPSGKVEVIGPGAQPSSPPVPR